MSSLHTSVRWGDGDETLRCLAEGADIDAINVYGFTPVMIAVQEQHLPILDLLLERGANVHLAHRNGRTALHLAAFRGNLAIVHRLVQAGADVNAVCKTGNTPMIEAALFNRHEVVSFLKGQGADSTIKSRGWFSAKEWTADEWLSHGGVPGLFEKKSTEK